MRILLSLSAILVFQVVIMLVSFSLNTDILPEIIMILFVPIVLVLASLLAVMSKRYFPVCFLQRSSVNDVSENELKSMLKFGLLLFFITLALKYGLHNEKIDYSSYKTVRESFLINSFGFIGFLHQLFMFLIVIVAGAEFPKIIMKNKSEIGFADVLYVSSGVVIPLLFMGSRSTLLLFFTSILVNAASIRKVLASRVVIVFSLFVVISLFGLGVIREIPLKNRLVPGDSFLVGPHLLHHNAEKIKGKTTYLERHDTVPPGYVLFSGFYVATNVMLKNFDIKIFDNHLEKFFWERHRFVYLDEFRKEYNSYYTAGLAVMIEGWLTIGILCFVLGLLPYILKSSYSRLIYLPILLFFALSVFKVSVFQNQALSYLVVIALIVEIIFRLNGNYILFKKKLLHNQFI